MKLKRIISWIFFPERCERCGEIKPFLKPYCAECGIDSKVISKTACPNCGHEKCMCQTQAYTELPHFSAVYYYEGQIKRSLLRFKFDSESSYADIFGKAMANRINELYGDINFDGICFVPMTNKARSKRGYNQSELLSFKIAEDLNIPVIPCLKKTRETHNQKNLSAKERTENVADSFITDSRYDIKGKTLILCDDIKTTGATLKECSDTLLKAGANDVYCVCLALTTYFNSSDIF